MTVKKEPTQAELKAQIEQLQTKLEDFQEDREAVEALNRCSDILTAMECMDNEQGIEYYRRLFVEMMLIVVTSDKFGGDEEEHREMMAIFDVLNVNSIRPKKSTHKLLFQKVPE